MRFCSSDISCALQSLANVNICAFTCLHFVIIHMLLRTYSFSPNDAKLTFFLYNLLAVIIIALDGDAMVIMKIFYSFINVLVFWNHKDCIAFKDV